MDLFKYNVIASLCRGGLCRQPEERSRIVGNIFCSRFVFANDSLLARCGRGCIYARADMQAQVLWHTSDTSLEHDRYTGVFEKKYRSVEYHAHIAHTTTLKL